MDKIFQNCQTKMRDIQHINVSENYKTCIFSPQLLAEGSLLQRFIPRWIYTPYIGYIYICVFIFFVCAVLPGFRWTELSLETVMSNISVHRQHLNQSNCQSNLVNLHPHRYNEAHKLELLTVQPLIINIL